MRTLLAPVLIAILSLMVSFEAVASERVLLVLASRMTDIQNPDTADELARLSTYLKKIRAENPRVLFIHGGNALGPSALSSFDSGAHMVGLLNWLEPQAMAVGKGEFFLKEDVLITRAGEAIFPFVCANVDDPLLQGPPEGIALAEVFSLGKSSLGFTAVASPELETAYKPLRVTVTGALSKLAGQVKELQRQGIAATIAVTDYVKESMAAASQRTGADVFIFTDAEAFLAEWHGKHFAVSVSHKDTVVLISLELDPDAPKGEQLIAAEASKVNLQDIEPDTAYAQEIKQYTSVLDALLNTSLNTVAKPFETLRSSVRSQENAFANYIADCLQKHYNADIAFMNGGGIRGNRLYEKGAVFTRRDLQSELPLQDLSILISLTGKQVWEALEHGVSQVENQRGMLLQVAGLRYTYDPAQKVGSRVTEVLFNNTRLNLDKTYSVGTVSYLATGGDNFEVLKNASRMETSVLPQSVSELVRVRISRDNNFAPVTEGRITVK